MKEQSPQIPLDYWAAFVAVADEGSVNGAATRLDKSASTISYTLRQLQQALGVELLTAAGRGLALTAAGVALRPKAHQLLKDARSTEVMAQNYSGGLEAELCLVVDAAFPQDLLLAALEIFGRQCRQVRLQLLETALSGSDEALFSGQVDLALSYRVPPGFIGERLVDTRLVAVVANHHPLAQKERLTLDELRQHRQFVVRDSGLKRSQDVGWLGADERWTVSHFDASKALIRRGLGFGWLPIERVRQELQQGILKALPLVEGQSRSFPMYCIHGGIDGMGPALSALVDALQLAVRDHRLQQWPWVQLGLRDEPG